MSETSDPLAVQEPCLRCGDDTAIGTCFFSDRDTVDLADGTRGYLCSECVKMIRGRGKKTLSLDVHTYAVPYMLMGSVNPHRDWPGRRPG